MWPIVVTSAIAMFIALIEIPILRKQGLKRECWVFLFFLLIGTALNIAYFLRIPLKNPTEWINACYRPVSDWFFQFF